MTLKERIQRIHDDCRVVIDAQLAHGRYNSVDHFIATMKICDARRFDSAALSLIAAVDGPAAQPPISP